MIGMLVKGGIFLAKSIREQRENEKKQCIKPGCARRRFLDKELCEEHFVEAEAVREAEEKIGCIFYIAVTVICIVFYLVSS